MAPETALRSVLAGPARRSEVGAGLAPLRHAVLFAAVGVLAAVGYVVATRGGLQTSPDSVNYLEGARSLADGHGYTRLIDASGREAIVNWPPGYSALLAPFVLAGAGVFGTAQVLNGVLFVATALIVGALVYRLSAGSIPGAAIAALLFVLSPSAGLPRYGAALSEAPFLLFLALFLLAFDVYACDGRRRWLLAASGAAAAAALTRNLGVAACLTWVLGVLLVPTARGRRYRDAMVLAAVSIPPFALWTLHAAVQEEATPRELGFYAPTLHEVRSGLGVVSDWFFPGPVPKTAREVLFAMLVGAVCVITGRALARRSPRTREGSESPDARRRFAVPVMFAIAYPVVLCAIVWFYDPLAQLDARLLSPLFLAVLVPLAAAIARSGWARPARQLVLAYAVVVLALYGYRTLDDLRTPLKDGGLTGSFFAESKLMDVATHVPSRALVYSNHVDAIALNTDRTNFAELPVRNEAQTGTPNPRFDEELRAVVEDVTRRGAIVVTWDVPERSGNLADAGDVASLSRKLCRVPRARGTVVGTAGALDRLGFDC